jgi:hypothetical protein
MKKGNIVLTAMILVVLVGLSVGVALAQQQRSTTQTAAAPAAAQTVTRVAPIMATPSFIQKGGDYTFYTTKGKMRGEVEEVTSIGWIKVAFESEFDHKPVWVNLATVSFIHEHKDKGEKE